MPRCFVRIGLDRTLGQIFAIRYRQGLAIKKTFLDRPHRSGAQSNRFQLGIAERLIEALLYIFRRDESLTCNDGLCRNKATIAAIFFSITRRQFAPTNHA